MAGLYYDEFKVGMEFTHPLTRTVTEMDNIMFRAMTPNPQPLQRDREVAYVARTGMMIKRPS